jgi:hypothetical protein
MYASLAHSCKTSVWERKPQDDEELMEHCGAIPKSVDCNHISMLPTILNKANVVG